MAENKTYTKPSADIIKEKLDDLQFHVTQQEGTEPPFKNKYWNHKEAGIYVDVVTGEPLFASVDKYDSGSGWPSFTKPISERFVTLHEDSKLFMKRTEVRSAAGDSHLGHVFDDGPQPSGKRYCVNSAALEFISVAELKDRGYEEYLALFAKNEDDPKAGLDPEASAVATFAGGCFWCMEPPFEKLDGVSAVISGYMGGTEKNPTYEQVSAGGTGHAEVVQIVYDPRKVTYETLLETYWQNIDPTTPDGQFVDQGKQYRPEIFYHTDEQKRQALASRTQLQESGKFDKPIQTRITAAGDFYRAEEYHQDYYKKNPLRYKFYRHNSGRDQYLEKVWGENDQ